MFWKRKDEKPATAGVPLPVKSEKFSGPRDIPEIAGRYLVTQEKLDPDWVWKLKAVIKNSPRGKTVFEVRVFDEAQVAKKQVKVRDWTTFDDHPELILYEGWFDKESLQANLEKKN